MKTLRYISLVVVLALVSCTVVPKPVTTNHASVGDSGRADSGLVAVRKITVLPAQPVGYQIDASARSRYNALIETYGWDPAFQPSLVIDQGIVLAPDGTIWITREGMRRFALLSMWRRSGKIPVKPTFLERITDIIP